MWFFPQDDRGDDDYYGPAKRDENGEPIKTKATPRKPGVQAADEYDFIAKRMKQIAEEEGKTTPDEETTDGSELK